MVNNMLEKMYNFNAYYPNPYCVPTVSANAVKQQIPSVPTQTEQENKSVKYKVAMGTTLSVAAVVACIAKKQGFSLNPKTIFNQNPKDWAIFKIYNKAKPNEKVLQLEEKEIISIGAGSVLGGLVSGCIFDDKVHRKAKMRESLNQMLGDILIPLGFVALPSRFYKAHKETILKKIPQFANKNNSKGLGYVNNFLKALPASAMTAGFLSAGIITGNRVSNYINEKVYHKKVDRGIKATDFAPHIDDLCLAISLMAAESPVGSIISKLIPFALMIAGNETGNCKESE